MHSASKENRNIHVVGITNVRVILACWRPRNCKVYIGPEVNGSINNGNTDVVVLGGLFPVHDAEENRCGKVFDSDMQWLEGMVLATQKINDDNSILPGVTLAFEIRDTCAQANIALEESLKFVQWKKLESCKWNGFRNIRRCWSCI